MHLLDTALQRAIPTVMVPRHGVFEPLQTAGQRFLAAGNGLWLEVCRPWLYARTMLCEQQKVAMPYGLLEERVELRCGTVPLRLVQAFSRYAVRACPNEAAGWIVWNERSGEFSLREVLTRSVSSGHIHFDRPRLEDDEHLVIDVHSHGAGAAYFSATDDRDDAAEVKIAMVLGHCDPASRTRSTAHRLCLSGIYKTLTPKVVEPGELFYKEFS